MSNTHEPHSQLTQELLRLLEQDSTQVTDRRAEILDQVLDRYDSNRDPVLETDCDSLNDVSIAGASRSHAALRVGAAALLITALLTATVFVGDRTSVTSTNASNRSGDEATASGTQLGLSMANGAVTFEPVNDLITSEGEDGTVLLGRSEGLLGVEDGIVVVDLHSSRFADRVAQLGLDGLVSSTKSTALAGGMPVERWSIGVTQFGSDQLGCIINEPCLELVEGVAATGLAPGTRVTVTEVVALSGDSVVFVADDNTSLRTDLTAMLATVSIS